MFPDLEEAFDADLTAVVRFTGVAILVLGFSNFIWSVPKPYMDRMGRLTCNAGSQLAPHLDVEVSTLFHR